MSDPPKPRIIPAPARAEFPTDHPCESIREYPVPDRARIRRVLADRCAWLERRIGENLLAGRGMGHHVVELAVLVQIEAEWTAMRRARIDVVDEMRAAINAAADREEIGDDDATRLYELAGKLRPGT